MKRRFRFLYRTNFARTCSASSPVMASTPRSLHQADRLQGRISGRLASLVCGAVLLLGGSAKSADKAAPVAPTIAAVVAEASARFGIPTSWIAAVMRIESGGRVLAVSPKGALGLMQIMPRTWTDLRDRYSLGSDPFDPHDNVAAGTAYIRLLFDRYGSPGFLAAYNAGPGRFEDHLATGRSLPAETTAYVARIAASLGDGIGNNAAKTHRMVLPWTESSLFSRPPISMATATEASVGESIRHSDPTTPNTPTSPLSPRSTGLFATGFVRTASR
jgi:hypothetical protein